MNVALLGEPLPIVANPSPDLLSLHWPAVLPTPEQP
jgi:hypothetical protein